MELDAARTRRDIATQRNVIRSARGGKANALASGDHNAALRAGSINNTGSVIGEGAPRIQRDRSSGRGRRDRPIDVHRLAAERCRRGIIQAAGQRDVAARGHCARQRKRAICGASNGAARGDGCTQVHGAIVGRCRRRLVLSTFQRHGPGCGDRPEA